MKGSSNRDIGGSTIYKVEHFENGHIINKRDLDNDC